MLANRVAINTDFITHRWILRSIDVAAAAAPAAGTSELKPVIFLWGCEKAARCFVRSTINLVSIQSRRMIRAYFLTSISDSSHRHMLTAAAATSVTIRGSFHK